MKPLYAQSFDNHVFSLQFETGVFYGTAYEILYENSHSSSYVSELQWNIKPLVFIGFQTEYAPKDPLERNALYFSTDIKFGIPMTTGVIEDRDWISPSTVPGSLTLFSSHDNKTTGAFLLNSTAGLSMPLARGFLAKLSLDFLIMYFKFEAWDGYTQYGTNALPPYDPWNPEWPKESFSGLGIDYSQMWAILKPAFGLEWHGEKIIFKTAFSVSTNAVCITEDNHFVRNPPLLLTGELEKGLFFETKGAFILKVHEKVSIGLSLSYTQIDDSRGAATLEEKYPTHIKTTTFPNCGGAGFRAFSGEIITKMSF